MSTYGVGPYGIGTPAVVLATGGSLLRNPEAGNQTGSRRIDPDKRDYVLDANGRTLGMDDVQQLVALALGTVKNSSAIRGFGNGLAEIETITGDIDRRVSAVIEEALLHLTERALIAILTVTTTRLHAGALQILVRWRDLTSNVEQTSEI